MAIHARLDKKTEYVSKWDTLGGVVLPEGAFMKCPYYLSLGDMPFPEHAAMPQLREVHHGGMFSFVEPASVVGGRILGAMQQVLVHQVEGAAPNLFVQPPLLHVGSQESVVCMDWSVPLVVAYNQEHPGTFFCRRGYLQMKVGSKPHPKLDGMQQDVHEYAHRLVAYLLHGPMDAYQGDPQHQVEGNTPLVVCHTCDRVQCLHPRHLVLGTQELNSMRRGVARDVEEKAQLKKLLAEDKRRWAARLEHG
jgi:Zinc-binding loop region of homing endonuclease